MYGRAYYQSTSTLQTTSDMNSHYSNELNQRSKQDLPPIPNSSALLNKNSKMLFNHEQSDSISSSGSQISDPTKNSSQSSLPSRQRLSKTTAASTTASNTKILQNLQHQQQRMTEFVLVNGLPFPLQIQLPPKVSHRAKSKKSTNASSLKSFPSSSDVNEKIRHNRSSSSINTLTTGISEFSTPTRNSNNPNSYVKSNPQPRSDSPTRSPNNNSRFSRVDTNEHIQLISPPIHSPASRSQSPQRPLKSAMKRTNYDNRLYQTEQTTSSSPVPKSPQTQSQPLSPSLPKRNPAPTFSQTSAVQFHEESLSTPQPGSTISLEYQSPINNSPREMRIDSSNYSLSGSSSSLELDRESLISNSNSDKNLNSKLKTKQHKMKRMSASQYLYESLQASEKPMKNASSRVSNDAVRLNRFSDPELQFSRQHRKRNSASPQRSELSNHSDYIQQQQYHNQKISLYQQQQQQQLANKQQIGPQRPYNTPRHKKSQSMIFFDKKSSPLPPPPSQPEAQIQLSLPPESETYSKFNDTYCQETCINDKRDNQSSNYKDVNHEKSSSYSKSIYSSPDVLSSSVFSYQNSISTINDQRSVSGESTDSLNESSVFSFLPSQVSNTTSTNESEVNKFIKENSRLTNGSIPKEIINHDIPVRMNTLASVASNSSNDYSASHYDSDIFDAYMDPQVHTRVFSNPLSDLSDNDNNTYDEGLNDGDKLIIQGQRVVSPTYDMIEKNIVLDSGSISRKSKEPISENLSGVPPSYSMFKHMKLLDVVVPYGQTVEEEEDYDDDDKFKRSYHAIVNPLANLTLS